MQSIEFLDKENIIDTQNKPIIVHASDQNYYYCKYHNGTGAAYRLFKEYLISCFTIYWGLNQTDVKFIEVQPEHVPINLGIPKRCFTAPCFGSKKILDAVMLSKMYEDVLLKSKGRQNIKKDIFTISFFDMIFANEDRHMNNYNILFSQASNEYLLYPIDHEACFNHGNIDKNMVALTYEDTLIYSDIFNKLFNNTELKDKVTLAQAKDKYYLCYRNCINKIEEIVALTPKAWQIDINQMTGRLKSFLTDEWFNECWREFLMLLQLFISDTR